MRKRTDGFTLVELMVVVLIIGVLVAIAVPVFNAAKANAEKNTCQANQRIWAGVVEAIKADDREPIYSNSTYMVLGTGMAWGQVAKGTYLNRLPVCPSPMDTYVTVYCVRVGPPGSSDNGSICADHYKASVGKEWSYEHSLGIP